MSAPSQSSGIDHLLYEIRLQQLAEHCSKNCPGFRRYEKGGRCIGIIESGCDLRPMVIYETWLLGESIPYVYVSGTYSRAGGRYYTLPEFLDGT